MVTEGFKLSPVLLLLAVLAGSLLVGLASLVAMSLYFARRSKRTEDYFVGGRSFAGWALGLSMLGTVISSNTFLALPARPTRSTGDNSA